MNRTALAALPIVAALALAGCSTTGQTSESTPDTEQAAASTSAPSVPTEMPSPPAKPVPTGKSSADPDKVKASASAAGRPEAAFDENCEVWKMPKADTERQKWANKLSGEWLMSHGRVECPDAIAYPFYFVDSVQSPARGNLVVTVDSGINKTENNKDFSNLRWIASDMMCDVSESAPELDKIIATTDDGSRSEVYTRQDLKSDSTSAQDLC